MFGMTFKQVRELIDVHCPDVLDLGGEVYFGSAHALSTPNRIAFIGLNPGGQGLPSIKCDLDRWELRPPGSVGYEDQCWHESKVPGAPGFANGTACEECRKALADPARGHIVLTPHQERVRQIAQALGISLAHSLALSAIWLQTVDAAELKRRLRGLKVPSPQSAFETWFHPVIREMLDLCDVRLVVCLGNSADFSSFNLFRRALAVHSSEVQEVGRTFRDGKFFVHGDGDHQRTFFGVPHPSRFAMSTAGMEALQALWKHPYPP